MRTKFVSVMLVVLALLLAVDASAQKRNATRETTVLGSEIYTRNSFNKNSRGLSQYLIIPKGEWQLGMQVSHVSISSNNSEYMLLLNNIDANGSITKISPFLAYSYRNNRSIGLRMQYSTASGRVAQLVQKRTTSRSLSYFPQTSKTYFSESILCCSLVSAGNCIFVVEFIHKGIPCVSKA